MSPLLFRMFRLCQLLLSSISVIRFVDGSCCQYIHFYTSVSIIVFYGFFRNIIHQTIYNLVMWIFADPFHDSRKHQLFKLPAADLRAYCGEVTIRNAPLQDVANDGIIRSTERGCNAVSLPFRSFRHQRTGYLPNSWMCHEITSFSILCVNLYVLL